MHIIVDGTSAGNASKHRVDSADSEDGFRIEAAAMFPVGPNRAGRKRLEPIGEMIGHDVVVVVSLLGFETVPVICVRPASEKARIDDGF